MQDAGSERVSHGMALHLSDVYGGPEFDGGRVESILAALFRAKEANHDALIDAQDGSLDIVFFIPGNVFRPPFEGMRPGRLSRKEKTLQIQVSIPEGILQSDDFASYVISTLIQAVNLGKQYLDRRKIPFSEEAHLALIERMRSAICQSPNSGL
jgi:hypothetical protein